jgi:N-acetylglucosamine kinase-like BadF-type ATPase
MKRPSYVFGGDVGRTKTSLCLVSRHGLTLGARSERDPGVRPAESVIRLARSLLCEHRIEGARMTVLGIAGCWTEEEKRDAESSFQGFDELGTLSVRSDAEIALYAGLRESPGVVVIAGTGAMAIGRTMEGSLERAGGHGHLLGDEGSGFWIGREGLAAALRGLEERGPGTDLISLLDTASPKEARTRGFALPDGAPGDVAAYAPRVIRIAEGGDGVARAIVECAAIDLALLVRSVLRRLKLDEEPEIRTTGGLFQSPFLTGLFSKQVRTWFPRAGIAPCGISPAYAAALNGLATLGFPGQTRAD